MGPTTPLRPATHVRASRDDCGKGVRVRYPRYPRYCMYRTVTWHSPGSMSHPRWLTLRTRLRRRARGRRTSHRSSPGQPATPCCNCVLGRDRMDGMDGWDGMDGMGWMGWGGGSPQSHPYHPLWIPFDSNGQGKFPPLSRAIKETIEFFAKKSICPFNLSRNHFFSFSHSSLPLHETPNTVPLYPKETCEGQEPFTTPKLCPHVVASNLV